MIMDIKARNQETQTKPAACRRVKKPRKKEILQEDKVGLSPEISLPFSVSTEGSSRNSLKKREVPEIDDNFRALSFDDAANQEGSREKAKVVSTEQKLLDDSWSWDTIDQQKGSKMRKFSSTTFFLDAKQQQPNNPLSELELSRAQEEKKVAEKIKSFRLYTHEEETEERKLRLSTKLNLYEDPFNIKKQLTGSDCGHLNRLMLSKETVRANILALMDNDLISQIEKDEGLNVHVWDYDTGTEHKLTFKRWPSSGCYLFGNNWKPQFVQRRSLKEKDVIAIFWNRANLRFGFRLLSSAPSVSRPGPLVT